MRRIIALSGSKGSGKTTTFDIIKELRPDVIEVTFAGKLKEVCSEVFNIPLETFHRPDLKEVPFKRPIIISSRNLLDCVSAYGESISLEQLGKQSQTEIETPRKLLQFIGTDVLRSIDDNILINDAIRSLPNSGLFVVTDVRMNNEFDILSKLGADIYHVDNDKAEVYASKDSHPSERERLLFKDKCIKISNNRTFEDLRKQVEEIL